MLLDTDDEGKSSPKRPREGAGSPGPATKKAREATPSATGAGEPNLFLAPTQRVGAGPIKALGHPSGSQADATTPPAPHAEDTVTVSLASEDDEGGHPSTECVGDVRAAPVELSLEHAPAASSPFPLPLLASEILPYSKLSLASNPSNSGGGDLPGLLGDSSVYTLAHQQILKMEAREKRVARSIARENEKFKAKEAYLAMERQRLDEARAAFNAAEASARATKRSLQLCLVAVLRGSSGSAEGSASTPAPQVQQIALIRSEPAKEIADLEEEHQKLIDEHHRIQSSSDEWLREQEEMLLSYSEKMEDLRASLEKGTVRERKILQEAS